MAQRNRSQGWEHAKRSGHENERLVVEIIKSSKEVQERLLRCARIFNIGKNNIEGIYLCSNVDSILPGKNTPPKPDIQMLLSDGRKVNISLKKDGGGQVYLIEIDRFMEGFELQYQKKIPSDVRRAIELYFGSAEDTLDIIKEYASKYISLQTRKNRLVADTLRAYNTNLADTLLVWVNENIKEIFDFCFVRVLAENPEDWAHVVWYKNALGENDLDAMINLSDAMEKLEPSAQYGARYGGSTIQLPFGFVQWHSPSKKIPGQMQFHHSYDKLISL